MTYFLQNLFALVIVSVIFGTALYFLWPFGAMLFPNHPGFAINLAWDSSVCIVFFCNLLIDMFDAWCHRFD